MTARTKGGIAVIVLTAVLLFVYYSYQIIHADHIAFGKYGDGYKNYYTLAYFLKYDSGSHFTGMNYPYGENVVFTDNQPAVAWALKFFVRIFPSFANHIHGFVVWIICASVLASSLFIYLILLEFEVGAVQAVIFAVLIAMMSPEVPRLQAHFSLGYTCYIPMLLWLLIKYFKTGGGLLYGVFLFVLITFFAFVHIYFLAFAVFFILPLILLFWLVNIRNSPKYWKFMGGLALCAFLPYIILKIYLFATDPITDRPQSPWGYTTYYSTRYDILLHPYSFTGQVMARLLPPGELVYHEEGMGYIGLATILLLVGGLIMLIISGRSAKKMLAGFYPLNYFFLPALAVLCFAMAIPFGFQSFQKCYNYLPMAIRQLRAAGRFNWLFYYVATITSAVIAWRFFLYLEGRRRYFGYAFTLIICSVWFIEINMISVRYRACFKQKGDEVNEPADGEVFFADLKNSGKSVNQFQAIMAFPFFLNGSEKIYLEGPVFDALETSLITGLPTVNCSMSRTSISQTLKIVDLLSGPLVHKTIISDFPAAKPLLLVTGGEWFSDAEDNLIAKGHFIFAQGGKRYYELPLSAFEDTVAQAKEFISTHRGSYFHHHGYDSDESMENAVVKRFEDEPCSYTAFGQGAHYSRKEQVWLYGDTLPDGADSSRYEISVWLYADPRSAGFPTIYYSQTNREGKEIEQKSVSGKFCTTAYGNWVRLALDFTLRKSRNKIYISASGDYATYDEFMIRPKKENIIVNLAADSLFSFNNYPLR